MMDASLRKATAASGRSHRCSSVCIPWLTLCACMAGQCSMMCSTEPTVLLQRWHVGLSSSPMRCMYEGMAVW